MNSIKILVFSFILSQAAISGEWLPLWPGEAPGGARPAVFTETQVRGPRVTDVAVPEYQVLLPEPAKRSGAAVVILPGGGYTMLAMGHEGDDYAAWLNARGIAAVLVKYRVSGNDAAGYQFPVPLLDARRAIRTARSKAADWGVDPAKIGVMGSSAGGHLASMCATLWDEPLPAETTDPIDALSCRPDFAVLVYPVIAMSQPFGHTGSKRRLLRENPDAALVKRVSTELWVNKQTPPCFIIHAADDPVVPVRNSLEFAARCAENSVSVTCHVFDEGGHGFGLKGKGSSAGWPLLLEKWIIGRQLGHTAADVNE